MQARRIEIFYANFPCKVRLIIITYLKQKYNAATTCDYPGLYLRCKSFIIWLITLYTKFKREKKLPSPCFHGHFKGARLSFM